MAICGHHYPMEGCHNCWLWMEDEVREAWAVIKYLKKTGAISSEQHWEALEAVGAASRETVLRSND